MRFAGLNVNRKEKQQTTEIVLGRIPEARAIL
jgi:hypothetical protein